MIDNIIPVSIALIGPSNIVALPGSAEVEGRQGGIHKLPWNVLCYF